MAEKKFDKIKANRTVEDSVFRDLFSEKKYLLQLYQSLHPEDKTCTEDDLEYVTLEQVLVRDIYNDLGFLAGDRLLTLIEAQSMWSVNIIVRSLLYVAKTYQDYFTQSKQSLYSTRKVKMPKPELYVLYTGKVPVNKEVITLSEEFFGGQESALEVKVKVITGGRTGDIIDQYVKFTEVSDEQIKLHGRTRETAADIVRICKDRDILKNYLTTREGEVTDMLTTLYDQDEVLELFIASERREAAEEAKAEAEKRAKEAAEEAKAEAEKKAEKKVKETAKEFYQEIYGNFLRGYYIWSLKQYMMMFDELPYEVFNEMKRTVLALFPDYKNSDVYPKLNNLERGLLESLEMEMTNERWDLLAQNYRYVIKNAKNTHETLE